MTIQKHPWTLKVLTVCMHANDQIVAHLLCLAQLIRMAKVNHIIAEMVDRRITGWRGSRIQACSESGEVYTTAERKVSLDRASKLHLMRHRIFSAVLLLTTSVQCFDPF